jgi:probable rRNA maturation factor
MPGLTVEIDRTDDWDSDTDWEKVAAEAVTAAFAVTPYSELTRAAFAISISIRFAEDGEVRELNRQWRGKDKATNVLSFPMLAPDELYALANADDGEVLLGDLILAHGVCASEAEEKQIPLIQHVTHLLMHGTLHLLGYDHIDDAEAENMEALEVKALASLGLANPYSDH